MVKAKYILELLEKDKDSLIEIIQHYLSGHNPSENFPNKIFSFDLLDALGGDNPFIKKIKLNNNHTGKKH